jgi:ribosomal protein S18 acetylase RimI-like enzyme
MNSVDAFLDYAKEIPLFDTTQVVRGKYGDAENVLFSRYCAFTFLNDSDNKLSVGNIEVDMEHRSSGVGTKAMNSLLVYADSHGVVLTLSPRSHSKSPISTPLLSRWYESMGFIKTPRGHERMPIN